MENMTEEEKAEHEKKFKVSAFTKTITVLNFVVLRKSLENINKTNKNYCKDLDLDKIEQ